MAMITILEKCYNDIHPAEIERYFLNLISSLDVKLRFIGTTNRDWIKLELGGKDLNIAINSLHQQIGFVHSSFDKIKKFATFKGKIMDNSNSKGELFVDLGINSSNILDGRITKESLLIDLTDGKDASFGELVKNFCFYENMPLEVKIIDSIKSYSKNVEAVLSEDQILLFQKWIRSRLDRLFVLGCLISKVKKVVKMQRILRDIIKIESLGLLEQVIVCKLGTDAVGLVPKIGRHLKSATLIPFSPKRIVKIFGNEQFDEV